MSDIRSVTQKERPAVPQIVNITRLRATTRKSTLLHFTEEQWSALSEGITRVEKFDNDRPA